MTYNIEPVFVIFPLVCLFFHFTNVKTSKTVYVILITLFILIYSFSLNGSDIDGYKTHYAMMERGATVVQNGQEIGYYYLMKITVSLGFDYLTFRIVLLSSLSIILAQTVRKFTDDFPLSLFFISSMFVVYTISAYRQYIVIAFSIWLLYQYSHGKKKMAIIGTCALLCFHVTAILPFACMIYESCCSRKRMEKSTERFKRNYIIMIILAIQIRVIMTVLLNTSTFNSIIGFILMMHASPNPTPLTMGLISRMIFLFLISYMYRASGTDNNIIRLLFWYYFISIFIYIAVPLEFVMGRLMNNAHILSAILIPMLRRDIVQNLAYQDVRISTKSTMQITGILEILAFIILINQLLHQNGYTPYLNILFGHTMRVWAK